MKICVTGADGFIGSAVVEELLEHGHSVKALAQYNSFGLTGWLKEIAGHPNLEVVLGDIRDAGQMIEFVSDCQAVCHLAALIAIPFSYRAPDAYFQTNVSGTLNLVRAAQLAGVRRFVHTSTSEVYGSALFVPMDESHPLQAQSPYSASKIGADALVASFFHSFEFPAVTLRPFNTFGPRQSRRAVIPTIASQFISRTGELHVGALDPRRDFTYVKDTARAFRLAVEVPNIEGEVINLGTGFDYSVAEVVEFFSLITDYQPKLKQEQVRIRPQGSEVERLLSDNSKALRVLGWKPELEGSAGFRAGLEATLLWLTKELANSAEDARTYAI